MQVAEWLRAEGPEVPVMRCLEPTCADSFDFRYPGVERVVYGAGSLGRQVPEQLREWGVNRVVVAASRSLADASDMRQLLSALNRAGVDALLFARGVQHCPLPVAVELMQAAKGHAAEALVAVGGSSVSDAAKAANLLAAFAQEERSQRRLQMHVRSHVARPLSSQFTDSRSGLCRQARRRWALRCGALTGKAMRQRVV